ncbi:MAG: Fic family protein [Deltaproteobacteria bacterium]|nr:Fic family protein [Deltaproteobacteria bacterium]
MDENTNYIPEIEPEKSVRYYNWKTAIGLQQVDLLTPSNFLIETANQNIEGNITIDEAERLIEAYYEHKPVPNSDEKRTEEADKVSLRIARILSSKAFKLSPVTLLSIHKRLFDGLYDFAGKIRDYNISKKEFILNYETVIYGDFRTARLSIDHDIDKEKDFDYSGLTDRAAIERIGKFIADLWQIHAFGEGNTRTIAVFTIKYLRTFGYDMTNDTFEKNSYYFRIALVRANYNDRKNGVIATQLYLNRFFGNLIFGENNSLQISEMRISKPLP